MKPKIWQKHIFLEMFKTQFFFLVLCFIIYGLMNFSFQSRHIFSNDHFNLFKIFQYYGQNFLLQLDIFLPLTFLLSLVKVITSMNSHNELVAFHMAGLSMKDLLKPVFVLASLCAAITFFNTEIVIPASIESNQTLKATHIRSSSKNKKTNFVNIKLLTDDSKIIFLKETSPHQFFDVYWICSNKEIWHIKELSFSPEKKEGKWVDHFIKETEKGFQKTDSYDTYVFTKTMPDEVLDRVKSTVPTENNSISSLSRRLFFSQYSSSREKAETKTFLHYKLAMPFLPFIIIFALSPFCFRFSRNLHSFAIFALSLLGFIVFYMIMDSMIILSENLVLPSFIAIWLPFLITTLAAGGNFFKKLYTLR